MKEIVIGKRKVSLLPVCVFSSINRKKVISPPDMRFGFLPNYLLDNLLSFLFQVSAYFFSYLKQGAIVSYNNGFGLN